MTGPVLRMRHTSLSVIDSSMTTESSSTTDYLITADLVDDGGSVSARTEALALRPGEEREIVLRPEDDIDRPTECIITAIQGDRRVLLADR